MQSICVIGLGTLGGFLSKCISDLDDLEKTDEICIIDYDIIEEKNLLNSIYRQEHLGQYKVDALEKIIKNNNREINVIKLNQKYIEGETKLPKKFDLVLDCRDFTYDRDKEIDARMYITGRTLVVDCRKVVQYDKHIEGRYTSFLSRADLKYAATEAARLIHRGNINLLIQNNSVFPIELDHLSAKVHSDISLSKDLDLIYEPHKNENKFVNLKESFNRLIELNKSNELTICLGNLDESFVDVKVPKLSLKTFNDVIQVLNPIVALPYTSSSYVIKSQVINNNYFIELLPDTGAA